jgi:quinol monooxygenase YgiN
MAIKVFIKRTFKPGHLAEASQLLNRARYGAMNMKGYISSETLSGIENPNQVVVISMWHDVEHWRRWQESPARSEFEAEFAKLLAGPVAIEVYHMGMQSTP